MKKMKIAALPLFATAILGLLVGAASVYAWNAQQDEIASNLIPGPIQYTCELSGGTFNDGSCDCPIEAGQTQDMMYDKSSGYCQTTFGGAGGDAFNAGSGLPWGHYSYYGDIVNYWCDESSGTKSGAACICANNDTYNKTTGRCE